MTMNMTDHKSYNATYAQLAEGEKAVACARELHNGQLERPNMQVVVSSTRKGHAELPAPLTHTRGGMLRGILLGGGVGLAAALIVGLLQVARGAEPNWTLVGLYGLLAAVMGCFAGGLVGSMNPLPKIKEMQKEGDVFVAVKSSDTSDVEWASRVLEKWGAQPELR